VRFFFEAGGDTAELLELGKAAFDEMALCVELPVQTMLECARWVVGDDRERAFVCDSLSQRIGIIGRIRHDNFGGQAFHQGLSLWRIALLTGGQGEPHGTSKPAHSHMDLGAQAPARAAKGLIFSPPLFGRGSMLMGTNDGAVDDQIFEVRIVRHRLEYPPPNPFGAPSAEATECAVPLSEGVRQISPR